MANRKLIFIILLFPLASVAGDKFFYVNGTFVKPSRQQILNERVLYAVSDTTLHNAHLEAQARAANIVEMYKYIKTLVNQNTFETIISDTRNLRADYLVGSSTLVTWVTDTYPSRPYYNAGVQARLLVILNNMP